MLKFRRKKKKLVELLTAAIGYKLLNLKKNKPTNQKPLTMDRITAPKFCIDYIVTLYLGHFTINSLLFIFLGLLRPSLSSDISLSFSFFWENNSLYLLSFLFFSLKNYKYFFSPLLNFWLHPFIEGNGGMRMTR